jgi:hypothetical protein
MQCLHTEIANPKQEMIAIRIFLYSYDIRICLILLLFVSSTAKCQFSSDSIFNSTFLLNQQKQNDSNNASYGIKPAEQMRFKEELNDRYHHLSDSLRNISSTVIMDFEIDSVGKLYRIYIFKGDNKLANLVVETIKDMPYWRTKIKDPVNSDKITYHCTISFPVMSGGMSYSIMSTRKNNVKAPAK